MMCVTALLLGWRAKAETPKSTEREWVACNAQDPLCNPSIAHTQFNINPPTTTAARSARTAWMFASNTPPLC
jgi:hypothetical protein